MRPRRQAGGRQRPCGPSQGGWGGGGVSRPPPCRRASWGFCLSVPTSPGRSRAPHFTLGAPLPRPPSWLSAVRSQMWGPLLSHLLRGGDRSVPEAPPPVPVSEGTSSPLSVPVLREGHQAGLRPRSRMSPRIPPGCGGLWSCGLQCSQQHPPPLGHRLSRRLCAHSRPFCPARSLPAQGSRETSCHRSPGSDGRRQTRKAASPRSVPPCWERGHADPGEGTFGAPSTRW